MADTGVTLPRVGGALLVGIAGVATGCAPPAPERPAPPVASAHVVATTPAAPVFQDAEWGPVRDVRHSSLVLVLPERSRWTISGQGEWLLARHAPTRSQLMARIWSAPRLVSADECVSQLGTWRPELPLADPDSLVEQTRADVPAGWRSLLSVGVRPVGAEIEGYAWLVGATVGRCLAVVYSTYATGKRVEQAVAERLALMVDGVLLGASIQGLEDRGGSVREQM